MVSHTVLIGHYTSFCNHSISCKTTFLYTINKVLIPRVPVLIVQLAAIWYIINEVLIPRVFVLIAKSWLKVDWKGKNCLAHCINKLVVLTTEWLKQPTGCPYKQRWWLWEVNFWYILDTNCPVTLCQECKKRSNNWVIVWQFGKYAYWLQ